MAKRKVTVNVPVEFIDRLKDLGVNSFPSFLETLFNDIEPDDLLDLLSNEDDEYWDEVDEYEDEL